MSVLSNLRLRRILIRALLIALWIGLGFGIFFTNRGHTLLVDNKKAADGSYDAVDLMYVTIDKQKEMEFMDGDRDRFTVAGANHKIVIEFTDGRPPYEGGFKLPIKEDMYLLSVPKMLAGMEFIEPFRSSDQVRQTDEEADTGEDDFAFLREDWTGTE